MCGLIELQSGQVICVRSEVKVQTAKGRARGTVLLHSALTAVDMLAVFSLDTDLLCFTEASVGLFLKRIQRRTTSSPTEFTKHPFLLVLHIC